MVFSSILFLFWFLPITLILYFMVPKRFKNIILLIASLFFYAWGEPKYIWIMAFSTVLDFTAGKNVAKAQIENDPKRAKRWLLTSIILNLSFLAFFKYSNFIILTLNDLLSLDLGLLSITLPIGISFYTFQTMSYTIDIYRKEAKAQKNIFDFATYVTLFPQLIAGPIVRYQDIADELTERDSSFSNISQGIDRFIIGLGKKVLLANNIGLLWQNISQSLSTLTVLSAWIGIISFAFQIYFDFSGYSDMAIGLGQIFGFHFPENFNYPYMSKSITEFWRRWHISLGTWFREYVYIPLGGNRVSIPLQVRNILVVWFLTGLWHGASWNFVIWGLYFGLILFVERFILKHVLKKAPSVFAHLYTLVLVLISWVIFAFDSIVDGWKYLQVMFGFSSQALINQEALYLLSSYGLLLLVLVVASTNLSKKLKQHPLFSNLFLRNTALCIVLLVSVAYLVDSTYNPFLYFRF